MKKFIRAAFLLLVSVNGFAKPVGPQTASLIAQHFYRQTTHNEVNNISLAYTACDEKGNALYYAYNINSGFVIISGDDAAQPVIGYSTEGNFVIPEKRSTIGNWLMKRGEEIVFIQKNNIAATAKIAQKWQALAAKYSNNNSTSSVVTPLLTTTWNQSPYYNALCPGGSVTGCVATAMAQIMKYWNYPATGNGSSSYMSNYGTLSCNYGATTYNWSNMPDYLMGSNNDVALINYHCGVSVEMAYSPTESGAWVCSFDNPVCAENSYKNYFRYDPTTIHGEPRSTYLDSVWVAMMKSDLDLGRPIQYVGWDPNAGGHTWVCDGYDQNDFLHMNWGWGGSGNGYYFVDNLNPSGFNFSDGHEAVLGIVPIASTNIDASVPVIFNPVGSYCSNNFSPVAKLQNMGSNNLTSCTINFSLDNGAVQTQSWNGSLVTGQFASISLPAFTTTPGTHTLVVYSTNPNGSADGNAANDQTTVVFSVSLPGALPIVEGFESGNISSTEWILSNSGGGNNFTITTVAAATGANSIMIDNGTNPAGSTSIIQTSKNYDLTTYNMPQLVFKMAYQAKTSSQNDRLQVFVSTNCGGGWVSKWARWANTLPTVSTTGTAPFVPSASDFVTYTVNLYSMTNSHNVNFRWKFFADANGPGNNLYIDDINIIDAVTSVNSLEEKIDLQVYPNPSAGDFSISLNLAAATNISYNITDMLGRTIVSAPVKVYSPGANEIQPLKSMNCKAGVYFVNLQVDGRQIAKKVIIE